VANQFLRFTVLAQDEDSARKSGILVVAAKLRDHGELTIDEHSQLRRLLDWFNTNLHVPPVLVDNQNRRALSWFKSQAEKPLGHMWSLVEILERHGIHVELHKTRNPGIVLYEDGWQIVAKPHRSTREGW
jgi:hypothetical protein